MPYCQIPIRARYLHKWCLQYLRRLHHQSVCVGKKKKICFHHPCPKVIWKQRCPTVHFPNFKCVWIYIFFLIQQVSSPLTCLRNKDIALACRKCSAGTNRCLIELQLPTLGAQKLENTQVSSLTAVNFCNQHLISRCYFWVLQSWFSWFKPEQLSAVVCLMIIESTCSAYSLLLHYEIQWFISNFMLDYP